MPIPKIREIKLDCRCIDAESLANLRLALLTAKDTYNDVASKLIGFTDIHKLSSDIKNIQEQARKFDALLHEFDKIPPC